MSPVFISSGKPWRFNRFGSKRTRRMNLSLSFAVSDVIRSMKRITKEETWRSEDLQRYMRGYEDENSRRRDKMKREEDGRKHRTGESADRRPRDPEREARREREKHRDRDSMKEGDRTRHRDPEKTRDDDRRRDEGHRRRDGTRDKEDRDKERRRERDKDRGIENDRYKDRERESWERRKDRAEKENRDREREKERERERNKERDGDKERERRRPEPERERRSEKDRKREEEREGRSDRDKDRLQEREKGRDKERERERRERHKDRESKQYRDEQQEKHRERERREKEYSGHRDQREHREHRREKEERERKKKEREQHETQGPDNSSRETERERRHRERKESDGHLAGNRDGEKEREKEKREKRHERSHRVESDTRRDDRERKQKSTSDRERSDKTSREKEELTVRFQSDWRSSYAEPSDPEIPVENEDAEIDKPTAEDYGNEEYEDDFEDYEEDFEEIDEDEDGPQEEEEERREEEEGEDSRGEIQKKEELNPRRREEIEAIQRAMDEENERVSSTPSRPRSEMPKRENRSKRSSTHGRIINFVAAKQREVSKKAASKQKKRTTELLRLIDLDFSITFPLLDLPPVNEYDMYIKNFGATNTRQAYVQCPDDNIDREIQTEEVDVTDKWTQHPAEGSIVCGGPKLSNESSVESVVQMNSMDSRRLTSFLRSAAQVVAVLLEEDRAERHSLQKLRSQTDALSFSDGCLQLNTRLPFLHGREVSLLQFSQVQRQTLLSVHAPCTKASAVRLDSNTIICIWNMWEPSRPQKILLYDGEVRCCCFSPGKARLVFAGTVVGSVVIWDLREHSREHYNLRIGEEDWTLRYPTFSTDAVLAGAGHLSTVRSVEPIVATVEEGLRPERPLMASQDESLELSFQLASLDEYGVLNLWVVVELPKADGAGSQTDLGLRPGGKVKLLHSSSINTCDKSTSRDVVTLGPSLSLQLKFLPKDSNHYYISTNTGLVRHGTLHGLKTAPKLYRSQVEGLSPVEVTALDFSPSGEPFFLAGCSDGSVRLYSIKIETPVQEWTGSSSGAAVVSVQWSVTRPSVFCVLDAASDLHVWDLNETDDAPLITEKIHNDRVTAVAMFGEPARQKVYAGLALAKHSGRIEIQYFNKKFTVPVTAESQKLHSLLHDAF
ncbi:WD repeat-containing protein 60 [Chanos chanos]|uniref:WD repeat-containing protein 60 n=1 Tax=Chanos chanos TaxID=29144 RepID=A0A6J2VUZ1_CHACN|nr:WD repeat-containing protein 60 [Chanos chanos]